MTIVPMILLALASRPGVPAGDEPPPKTSLSASKSSATASPRWQFVLPAPGDPFEHAPFRALVLSREKPEDLIENADYRGDPSRRRYAQIRFGSAGSIRVTSSSMRSGPGDADLYVDADRNRKIDDRDRVQPGDGRRNRRRRGGRRERIWRLPLDVAMVDKDDDPDDSPRRGVPPGRQRPDPRLRRGRLPRAERSRSERQHGPRQWPRKLFPNGVRTSPRGGSMATATA